MEKDEKIELYKSIDKYIRGELSQEEIDRLWIRFLQNPEHYKLFEAELHLRNLIEKGDVPPGLKEEVARAGKSNIKKLTSAKIWLMATAAAVLITFGLQFFSVSEDAALQKMAMSTIDTAELMGTEIMRSDDEEINELDIEINDALANALADESDVALYQFQQLLDEDLTAGQRVRVEMNLGVLFYNRAEYEESMRHFRSVVTNEDLDRYTEEKAWWFLGNVYLNIGDAEDAREAVFNAYTLDGRFQAPALALLKNLDVQLGYIPSEPLN